MFVYDVEVQNVHRKCLEELSHWIKEKRLDLASSKTEADILNRNRESKAILMFQDVMDIC